MPVELASDERRQGAPLVEHAPVECLEQADEGALVRRRADDHARAQVRRKLAVVEKVVVEGDERAAELARAGVVLAVRGAAPVGLLEDEEHVPAKRGPHVAHDAPRHVGVGVDARRVGHGGRERGEAGSKRAHVATIAWRAG